MQIGIQVLFAGLVIFTVVMALVLSPPHLWRILTWEILLILVHTALMATHVMDRTRRDRWRPILVTVMVATSILLAVDFPYAAYLTIPLSFVYLDHLAPLHACISVVVGAVAIVLGVGLTSGWSVGGVVGPVAGAAVAVVAGPSGKLGCWRNVPGWHGRSTTPSRNPCRASVCCCRRLSARPLTIRRSSRSSWPTAPRPRRCPRPASSSRNWLLPPWPIRVCRQFSSDWVRRRGHSADSTSTSTVLTPQTCRWRSRQSCSDCAREPCPTWSVMPVPGTQRSGSRVPMNPTSI